jgi:molybdopterin biosynthesis enzyme
LPAVKAELLRGLTDSSNRRSYLPARFSVADGRAFAEPLKWGGSSDLVAFMEANSLVIVDEEVHQIDEGQKVDLLLLDGPRPGNSNPN